jgi:hypothetical protein
MHAGALRRLADAQAVDKCLAVVEPERLLPQSSQWRAGECVEGPSAARLAAAEALDPRSSSPALDPFTSAARADRCAKLLFQRKRNLMSAVEALHRFNKLLPLRWCQRLEARQ